MVRANTVAAFSLALSACYLSHELPERDAEPRPGIDSGPDAGSRDAGRGLTDEERRFLAAYKHAVCACTLARGELPELHGDVDACVRMLTPSTFATLENALVSGALVFRPDFADVCLAETAVCAPPWRPPPGSSPCDVALSHGSPRAAGARCSVSNECDADARCASGGTGTSLDVPCTFPRCRPASPVGTRCTDGRTCEQPFADIVACTSGICTEVHHIEVPDGEACGSLPSTGGSTELEASCGAASACGSTPVGLVCVPRRTEGRTCAAPVDCTPGLACLRGACRTVRWLGLGEPGCYSAAAALCDGARDLFCDESLDRCVAAGDGSAGTACSLDFPCDASLTCVAGHCTPALPDAALCDTSSHDPVCANRCDSDGVCAACG